MTAAKGSGDRKTVTLTVPGLRRDRVVHLRSPRPFSARDGETLWSTEAWYTLDEIPGPRTRQVFCCRSWSTRAPADRRARRTVRRDTGLGDIALRAEVDQRVDVRDGGGIDHGSERSAGPTGYAGVSPQRQEAP